MMIPALAPCTENPPEREDDVHAAIAAVINRPDGMTEGDVERIISNCRGWTGSNLAFGCVRWEQSGVVPNRRTAQVKVQNRVRNVSRLLFSMMVCDLPVGDRRLIFCTCESILCVNPFHMQLRERGASARRKSVRPRRQPRVLRDQDSEDALSFCGDESSSMSTPVPGSPRVGFESLDESSDCFDLDEMLSVQTNASWLSHSGLSVSRPAPPRDPAGPFASFPKFGVAPPRFEVPALPAAKPVSGGSALPGMVRRAAPGVHPIGQPLPPHAHADPGAYLRAHAAPLYYHAAEEPDPPAKRPCLDASALAPEGARAAVMDF